MSTVGNWRGPSYVKDSLVLYVNADSPNSYYPDTALDVWKDISGYGYNGTMYNTPTYETSASGVFSFDGTNEYVSFGDTLPINGSGTVSFSMWVYASTNTTKLMFTRYDTSAGTRLADYVALVAGTTGMTPRLYVGTTNNYIYWTATTEAVSLNTWTNLTFTTNNTNTDVKCYVNGTQISVTSTTSGIPGGIFTITVANKLWKLASSIGATGVASYFDFKIGDLLVYNKTLTATEVLQNYNASKTRFGY